MEQIVVNGCICLYCFCGMKVLIGTLALVKRLTVQLFLVEQIALSTVQWLCILQGETIFSA
jgi:hypothetical protein